jgi:hypothetical protein
MARRHHVSLRAGHHDFFLVPSVYNVLGAAPTQLWLAVQCFRQVVRGRLRRMRLCDLRHCDLKGGGCARGQTKECMRVGLPGSVAVLP